MRNDIIKVKLTKNTALVCHILRDPCIYFKGNELYIEDTSVPASIWDKATTGFKVFTRGGKYIAEYGVSWNTFRGGVFEEVLDEGIST